MLLAKIRELFLVDRFYGYLGLYWCAVSTATRILLGVEEGRGEEEQRRKRQTFTNCIGSQTRF